MTNRLLTSRQTSLFEIMGEQKRNAIIMAAGTASRFVPLSSETPKGLLEVKGEILIERQIRQLLEAGITDITIVVGYKAEKFTYLKDKYGVELVLNEDFDRYNNTSSVIRVLDRLGDTYICSSDNYFPENVFCDNPKQSYYSALYSDNETGEYCIGTDSDNNITKVVVGGKDSWYMVGHVYFSKDFSDAFKKLLAEEYVNDEVKQGYWEDVYIKHIDTLPPITIRKYHEYEIKEFDSLDELRAFDESYIYDTRSSVLKGIAERMGCKEEDLSDFTKLKHNGDYLLFSFLKDGNSYCFNESDNTITMS